LHAMTRASVQALAGQGLIGVAKDEFPRQGGVWSFIAAFAEVEVDIDTGEHRVLEYLPVADVGTVLHPRSLGAQLHGGGIQGFGEVAALAGSAAVLCAIQNAIGNRCVLRTPVTADRVLEALAANGTRSVRLTAYA